MRRWLAAFPLALEFLTVVRWRRLAKYDGPTLGASLAWFPAVGLLIGALLMLTDTLAARVLPAPALAGLLVAVLVVVTGALHLDGLADSADGIFGGHTPERRLAIMRDPHTGSFGVAAVALALLLEFAALLSLAGPARRPTLLLVPALARFAVVLAVALFPYARPAGLGRLYHDHALPAPLAIATLIAVLSAFATFQAAGIALLAVAGAVAFTVGALVRQRLGGLTGDVYGAVGVVAEVVLLLVAAGAADHGWLRGWGR